MFGVKYIKVLFLYILCAVVIFLCTYIYLNIYYEKCIAANYAADYIDYLKQKYDREMIYEETFSVDLYDAKTPLIEKETINEDGSVLTFDDYEFKLFRHFIINSLKTEVERIWNKDTFINVAFDSESVDSMYRPPVPKEINEYMLVKEMEPYWDYNIIIGDVTLNSENKQFVAEQIFKLYQAIKDNDLNPNKIKIFFKGQTQNEDIIEDITLVNFYYTKETSINDILSVLNSKK